MTTKEHKLQFKINRLEQKIMRIKDVVSEYETHSPIELGLIKELNKILYRMEK